MKKTKVLFAFVSVIILILVLIYYFFVAEKDLFTSDTVIVIGNEKVSLGEFKVYLFEVQKEFENQGDFDIWDYDFEGGKTALEAAKESAINTVVHSKISGMYAKDKGIKLTDDEISSADGKADEVYNSMPEQIKSQINITADHYRKIYRETAMYYKVYGIITEGITFSEKNFEEYMAEYIESRPYDYEISEEEVRESYILFLKRKIFNNEFAKWSSNYKLMKNEELIRSVQLIK